MAHVHEMLEAWRAAERELEAATDPEEIERLTARVSERHKAYREAMDRASVLEDVAAHSNHETNRSTS